MDGKTTLGIGVHEGLGFYPYHQLEAWGSSSLRAMRRGPPARVIWEKENQALDTEATRIGSAVHCLVLTPELYGASYSHKPEGMLFSTRKGKAWRDDPAREDTIILTHAEATLVAGIAKALFDKDLVSETLADASMREVSFVWKCSRSGQLCKGRPDWIEKRLLYDLKVSRHAGGKALAYRAFVEGWMHQLAHYRTGAIELGLNVRGGRLVVVDPLPPHFVFALEVKVDALDLLELENLGTLEAMAACAKAGEWPGTADEWVKIEPPAAALIEFGEATVSAEGEVL